MTWTIPPSVGSTITKIAVAGVLIAMPAAALSVPAFAAPGSSGTPSVLPAPPPADPPTDAPAPPAPPPAPQAPAGEYYNPNDWWYNGSADGGGGGG
ncbi:MAG: hypothetical protein WBF57_27870 [Mycobacterium sp.]